MSSRKTLTERMSYRIARMGREVFMRDDFKDLGGYDQVGRVLRQLVAAGRLVRVGYGVYARAKRSSITGQPMLATRGGFAGVIREALDRLKARNKQFKAWFPSQAELDYNAGLTTQVPVNTVVTIKGRLSRKLAYRDMELLSAA